MSLRRREAFAGYLFAAPVILGFLLFTMGPIIVSIFFSLTDYDIISPPRWIGLNNYGALHHDSLFWQSMMVTSKAAVIALPLGLVFFQGSPHTPTQTQLLMAMSLILVVPCIAAYFFAQRMFIQGIVITGVKG
jgi:ABC-type spermidine/putrescine transport system permease subunit I